MGARAKSFKARIEDFEAEDVRAFYDNSMFRVWHLENKERTFRITRVRRVTKQEGDEVEKRAVVYLADRHGVEMPLPLELNPTNRDTIIGIYGVKKSGWIGQLITLYPTECEAFGKMQACIRIRPFNPARNARRSEGGDVRDLPPRQPAPRSEPRSEPPPPQRAAEPAPESSGLELDAGGNDYRDSTDDEDEPPFGSLLTDNAGNVIR